MPFNLTVTQRRIAFGAAAVVTILLVVQMQSAGIEKTPWMVGVLVVAALLAVGLAPAKSRPAEPTPQAPTNPKAAFVAARAIIEPEFVALAEETNKSLQPTEMTAAFVDHARLQAIKLAWIAAAMAIAQRDISFVRGDRMPSYAMVGGEAARAVLKSMPGSLDGKDLIGAAAKEIGYSQQALEASIRSMAAKSPNPMTNAYALIERDFPFAQSRRPDIADPDTRMEATYGPIFRSAVSAAIGKA